jgi:hypothetical protein
MAFADLRSLERTDWRAQPAHARRRAEASRRAERRRQQESRAEESWEARASACSYEREGSGGGGMSRRQDGGRRSAWGRILGSKQRKRGVGKREGRRGGEGGGGLAELKSYAVLSPSALCKRGRTRRPS